MTNKELKPRILGYKFRPDGMFLCRCTCVNCGKEFDLLALSNHQDYCCDCLGRLQEKE